MFLPIHLLTAINSHKCNHKVYVLPIQIISFPNQISHFHEFSPERSRFPSLFPVKSVKFPWNRAIGVAAKTGRRRPALERYGWGRLRREPWRTIPLIGYDWLMWVKVILWKSTLLGWYVFFGIIDDCTILYHIIPVVQHKAVAEVSNIGNL